VILEAGKELGDPPAGARSLSLETVVGSTEGRCPREDVEVPMRGLVESLGFSSTLTPHKLTKAEVEAGLQ
jgi:hypothetical protein